MEYPNRTTTILWIQSKLYSYSMIWEQKKAKEINREKEHRRQRTTHDSEYQKSRHNRHTHWTAPLGRSEKKIGGVAIQLSPAHNINVCSGTSDTGIYSTRSLSHCVYGWCDCVHTVYVVYIEPESYSIEYDPTATVVLALFSILNTRERALTVETGWI